MKKTIYLISGLILLVLIIIVSIFFSSKKKETVTSSDQAKNIPTSVPIPTNINNTSLQITSTDPTDKKIAVSVNQIITITFNKKISSQDVTFTLLPTKTHILDFANNQLIISFSSNLLPNTTYYYTIKSKDNAINHQYTFTTSGTESAKTNDNAAQALTNGSRALEPDLFLYNRTPYATTDFSITGAAAKTPPYHFYFTISLIGTNKDQSKQEFIAWLISLGLTNDQIKTLDIRYQ